MSFPHVLGEVPKLCLADKSFRMNWVASGIRIGESFRCLGGAVYNPSNFYLNPSSSWNALEGLQHHFCVFYEKGHTFQGKKPHPPAGTDEYYKPEKEDLAVGMFVAVIHSNLRREWHRAMIIDVDEERVEDNYKLLMIDYGDHKYFSLSAIRLIPIKFLEKLPAQGISCKLHFTDEGIDELLEESGGYWTEDESKIFTNSMANFDFKVFFLRSEITESIVSPVVWHVKMHKYNKVRLIYDDPNLFSKTPWDEQLVRKFHAFWKTFQPEKAQEFVSKTCYPSQDQGTFDLEKKEESDSELPKSTPKYPALCFIGGLTMDEFNVSMDDFKGVVVKDCSSYCDCTEY